MNYTITLHTGESFLVPDNPIEVLVGTRGNFGFAQHIKPSEMAELLVPLDDRGNQVNTLRFPRPKVAGGSVYRVIKDVVEVQS